jgi:uncharacterized membrane protein (UPF0127 family)
MNQITTATRITVDVADTPELMAQGLMWVKEMPQNHGMLFKFPHKLEASFWGKNTYLPLDIAFVDEKGTIVDINHIAPMSTRLIHSKGLCEMAIETNAGFFKENNIGVGHRIEIRDNEVTFKES